MTEQQNNCIMCDNDLEENSRKLLDGLPVCEGECREKLKENGTGEQANVGGVL